MANEQLHADIAGLRADLQATNQSLSRITDTLEKITDDHEKRLRTLEEWRFRAAGILALIGFIGFPAMCAILYLFSKGH